MKADAVRSRERTSRPDILSIYERQTRRQASVEWQNRFPRPMLLVAAILIVTVGAIPWWVAVPLLVFFGAASLAGLIGGADEADL